MVSVQYRWILQVAHAKVYVPAWLWCFANNSPIWKLVLYSSIRTILLLNKKVLYNSKCYFNRCLLLRQRMPIFLVKSQKSIRPQVNKSTRLCRVSLKGSTISGPTDKRQRTTDNGQQTTDKRQQTTDNGQRTRDYKSTSQRDFAA